MSNSVIVVEQTGSFHETYVAGSTVDSEHSFPSNVIHPIYFNGIFAKLMQVWEGHLLRDWTEYLKQDYIYGVSFELTSLIAFYELPSKLLAGFPGITEDDSDAEKTQKLLDNYSRFQKVGLKLWIKQEPVWRNRIGMDGNTTWMPVGETILQNKGIQMKINLLPYLGAKVFGVSSGAIGFQFVDKGNGRLGATDYVTVIGEWGCTITAFPRVIGAINLVHALPPTE